MSRALLGAATPAARQAKFSYWCKKKGSFRRLLTFSQASVTDLVSRFGPQLKTPTLLTCFRV